MSERTTSDPTGYRSEMQLRRLARSTSARRRIRALDHDPAPTDAPPVPENQGRTPARKTAPRRPATRHFDAVAEPHRGTERPVSEVAPDRDYQWRSHADETDDGLEDLDADEFPEPELCEPDEQFHAPAIRDAGSLPPTLSIVEAGEWLGIGRTVAYELARDGAFPVRTIRVGNQRRVITVELLAMLGIPLAR